MEQINRIILHKIKQNKNKLNAKLTFFFFRSDTRTPSTETSKITFFFLIPFALNSYCNKKLYLCLRKTNILGIGLKNKRRKKKRKKYKMMNDKIRNTETEKLLHC